MQSSVILKKVLADYRNDFKRRLEMAKQILQEVLEKTEEEIKNNKAIKKRHLKLLSTVGDSENVSEYVIHIIEKYLGSNNVISNFGNSINLLASKFSNSTDGKKEKAYREIKKVSSVLMDLIDQANNLELLISNLESAIKELNNLIQSYDNDKVKNETISIARLVRILNILYVNEKINVSTFSDCLGMAIYRNYYLLLKNRATDKMEYQNLCRKLGVYYNEDGTFTLNENTEEYFKLMTELESLELKARTFIELLLESSIINKLTFAEQFTELLKESNDEKIKKQKEAAEKESQKSVLEDVKTLDYDALKYVRKYYKNADLIAIPTNIPKFSEMLDKSGMSLQEKRYILNLINAQVRAAVKESILGRLDKDESIVYNRAKEVLALNQSNDSNYCALLDLIGELEAILSLYDDTKKEENVISLDEEKSMIIEKIKNICFPHQEKASTDNNLVFLKGNDNEVFFQEDLNQIDKRIRENIIPLLKNKVVKEKKNRFRKVYIANGTFQPFEVFNGSGKIFCLELHEGIYLILGAGINDKSYRTISNRVLKYYENIQGLIKDIKDPKKRESILVEEETILNSLLSLDVCESKARKKIKL